MIIVFKQGTKKELVNRAIDKIEKAGLRPVPLFGTERTVIAVLGDERSLSIESLRAMPGVEKVMPVLKPYKLASREFHPKDTIIDVKGVKIGGKNLCVMAGPCSVEGKEQIFNIAKSIKKSGAKILRGGAFKPRTGPYDFQGLGEEGLKYLAEASAKANIPMVTEVMEPGYVGLVAHYADIIQIGTRNMQNYPLLKEVGKINKPVLLKRGMWATYKEWLLAAEYIMSEGNHKVILCERGIRTFETYTRNTLDINAIPALKEQTHLPVIVDPSHGTGRRSLVNATSKAAIAAGADGLMIEVHPHPESAVTDADQTISTEQFRQLMKELKPVAKAVKKKL